MEKDLLHRITHNPEICHGKPCIRRLRYSVELILELLSSGMTMERSLPTMMISNQTIFLPSSAC